MLAKMQGLCINGLMKVRKNRSPFICLEQVSIEMKDITPFLSELGQLLRTVTPRSFWPGMLLRSVLNLNLSCKGVDKPEYLIQADNLRGWPPPIRLGLGKAPTES
jgi:hypothetical protein